MNNEEHMTVTIGEAYNAEREQLQGLIKDLATMIMQSNSSTFHGCEEFLSGRIKEQVTECEKILQLGRTVIYWRNHKELEVKHE